MFAGGVATALQTWWSGQDLVQYTFPPMVVIKGIFSEASSAFGNITAYGSSTEAFNFSITFLPPFVSGVTCTVLLFWKCKAR